MISTSLGCDVSPYLLAACPFILKGLEEKYLINTDCSVSHMAYSIGLWIKVSHLILNKNSFLGLDRLSIDKISG